MGVTVLVFAVELQKVRTTCIFSDFWEEDWGEIQNGMNVKGEKKKAFKWKSKWVSTSLTSTRWGSPWGSRTQQHAYCLRYAHSQHIETHLGKKQTQAKISITFLFSQLHFNNVTLDALFYGDHLVMRSKRCAVQNRWITLTHSLLEILPKNAFWS